MSENVGKSKIKSDNLKTQERLTYCVFSIPFGFSEKHFQNPTFKKGVTTLKKL